MKASSALSTAAAFLILIAAVFAGWKLNPGRPRLPTSAAKTLYQCTMHPEVVRDGPGDCPICQMRLQPAVGDSAPQGQGHVPGRAPFTLSSQRQQLIGVTFAQARRRALERVIHTAGTYSPDSETTSAKEEYRKALRAARAVLPSATQEDRLLAQTWVQSARAKLGFLGLSQEQILGISPEPAQRPSGNASGTASAYAEVYEYEVPFIKPGQVMEITSPDAPGEVFRGRVMRTEFEMNTVTRTARVRGEILGAGRRLSDGSTLTINIRVPLGEWLAIPSDAVLDQGERQIVFVVDAKGRFEPRVVRIGLQAQGYSAVLSGLEEGATVVSSAGFLIDSESQLRAAVAAFGSEPHAQRR